MTLLVLGDGEDQRILEVYACKGCTVWLRLSTEPATDVVQCPDGQ